MERLEDEYYVYYSCLCGKVRSPYWPIYNPAAKCPDCKYRPVFLHGKPNTVEEGEILASTARPRAKEPPR